jgi:hypothetical protein
LRGAPSCDAAVRFVLVGSAWLLRCFLFAVPLSVFSAWFVLPSLI